MDVARHKPLPASVQLATVDAYTFAQLGSQTFDGASFNAAFAGCWWSHVPLPRLQSWLDTLQDRKSVV